MEGVVVILCILVGLIVIYIAFRLAGLAWFRSMIDVLKTKQEDSNGN